MITFLVVIILVYVLIVVVLVFIDAFLFVRVVIMAQSAHLMVSGLPLLAEAILGLTHLIMLGPAEHSVVIFAIIVENFFLLRFLLVFLKRLDNLILLLPSLLVL